MYLPKEALINTLPFRLFPQEKRKEKLEAIVKCLTNNLLFYLMNKIDIRIYVQTFYEI